MKLEIEIPDELARKVEPYAAYNGLSLPDAVASLAIIQACASGIMFRPHEWDQPFHFETFVLPWGVRVTMNREAAVG